VAGVCPSGWHVPSFKEWTSTLSGVDPTDATTGKLLKSTEGWLFQQGTDAYGFRALAGGSFWYVPTAEGSSFFEGTGFYGNWWSATDASAGDPDQGIEPAPADSWYCSFGNMDAPYCGHSGKADAFSVRCLKN
jgi:uncharacterized protein (TIGR02145 family)